MDQQPETFVKLLETIRSLKASKGFGEPEDTVMIVAGEGMFEVAPRLLSDKYFNNLKKEA